MKKLFTFKIPKKTWLVFFSIFLLSVQVFSSYTVGAQTETIPVITLIAPATIHYGDIVDISGSGFGNDGINNGSIVFVTGTSQGQNIKSWTDTQIKVEVNNIPNGPYSDSQFTLIVGSRSSGSLIYSNAYLISVLGLPRISQVNPTEIHVDDEIEINGENFGDGSSNNGRVLISGSAEQQTIISWSNTKIKAKINNINGFLQTEKDNLNLKGFAITGITLKTKCRTVCPSGLIANILASDGVDYIIGGSPLIKILKPVASPPPLSPAPALQPSPLPSPVPQTTCTEDVWSCQEWNSCSASGIQTRSCKRTFDCSDVETAPPETSQLCQAPITQPKYQQQYIPESPQNVSTTLIKATVKLMCLNSDKKSWSQGSGTVINQNGTILTNSHVVKGTLGCAVGFINDPSDDPNFSEIAFVTKISSDKNVDVALLKINNVNGKTFNYINISNNDANKLRLGEKIMILGYPDYAQSGESNLTYTSGDFSGFGSSAEGLKNYFKTSAQLEHGNSGGGAYTSNNIFVGIPTLVIKGALNSLSYILSINKINSWMNSSSSNISSTQQHTGITISSLTDIIGNEDYDSSSPDLSNTRVIIYSDHTKQQVLPSTPGQKQTKKKPLFQTSGTEDESGIAGYYVYFGQNINADPIKQGKFIKKTTYSPPTITKKGVYYFIFKAKDKAGNISNPYITEYKYKK